MKKIGAICIVSVMSILLTGCCLSHEWQEATCTTPKTCAKCGETEGEALGHEWQEATCTEPKTCSICGETEGEALGHHWQEATCTEPKTCSVCDETEGEALGHEWQEATCQVPKTCSVCGETEGDIGDHAWVDATCLAPKTCSICGEIVGEIASHNFNENGICTTCGTSREIQLTMDNVDDFLTVTFTSEFEIDTYYTDYGYLTCVITVAPVSDDYIFQNVQVRLGREYGVYFEPLDNGHNIFYDLDSNGNLVYTDGPTRRGKFFYDAMIGYRIYEIKGTCIRK